MHGCEARERLVTVKEVADALNVGTRWVYEKAERGQLPVVRVGRYLRFRMCDVFAHLEGRGSGGDSR